MGNTSWQFICIGFGVFWTIAGDPASASSWLAASVVIGRIGNKDK